MRTWILMAISLILTGIIDNRDRTLALQGTDRKEKLTTWILIFVLAFACGLRTQGNDTITYIESYDYLTPTWQTLHKANIPPFAKGLGFFFLNVTLKTLGFSTQNFLMFYAFLTIILYVLFVRRYSRSMTFGVFLMFTTGFYGFASAAIKQCMATGICLTALQYALDKKWWRYYLTVGVASLFHPYAVIYFLAPLMLFKPLTNKTYIYMAIFILAGFLLDTLIGTVLDITDMMGATYNLETFSGEGVNAFRVAVSFVPLLLALLCGKKLFENSTQAEDLMFNLAMLNALIMFVGLFGTANFFARLANYFLPAQVIVLPWILGKLHHEDKKWLVSACILGYLGYFFYENTMRQYRQAQFANASYEYMSLWEYLSTLFK